MPNTADYSFNDSGGGVTRARGGSIHLPLITLQKRERQQAGPQPRGPGSHHRTFAHAVPAAEQNAFPSVCPARPCFLLTHIPTRPPSVPRSLPPCNFLRYPIIYSFILFMSALPPFS